MGRARDLPILLAAVRHVLAGDRNAPMPDGSDFARDDQHRDHARAIITLPAAARELIDARRARDNAWARGRMVEAQRHGARIAECEHVIEGLLALLRKPAVRVRHHPSRRNPNAKSPRAQEAAGRVAEIRELIDQGLSGAEISRQLGVSTASVSRARYADD